MSIALAIFGHNSISIAADSRCIWPDGKCRDDYNKLFALPNVAAIGAFVGLMEFAGQSISQRIIAHSYEGVATIDDLATTVSGFLVDALRVVDENEIGFAHRRVEILLAARQQLHNVGALSLRLLTIRPDRLQGTLIQEVEAQDSGRWAFGDARAKTAALKYIADRKHEPHWLGRARLESLAKRSVTAGIRRAGPHSHQPSIISCGGSPRALTL